MAVPRDTCRSCGASVMWVQTENGKAMPVDVRSSPVGNLALRLIDDQPLAEMIKGQHDGKRYTSHFATCPDSEKWKRSKAQFRANCCNCESNGKRCFWSSETRERVLARCEDCGANFDGPGRWRPLWLFAKSSAGLSLQVDPHLDCAHGHGPCPAMWRAGAPR